MSNLKRCAACRTEKPVSEMEVCMHHQMHNYVCDSKCMNDFYNPPKPSNQIENLTAELSAERARVTELEEKLKKRSRAYMVLAGKYDLAGGRRAQLAARGEPDAWLPVDRKTGERWLPTREKGNGLICDYFPLYIGLLLADRA